MKKLFKKLKRNLGLDIIRVLKANPTAIRCFRQNISLEVCESVLSPREVALIRQYRDFGKRYIDGIHGESLDLAADNTFINAAKKCEHQNMLFTPIANFGSFKSVNIRLLFMAREILHTTLERAINHENSCFKRVQVAGHFEDFLVPIAGFSTGGGSTFGCSEKLLCEKYAFGGDLLVDTPHGRDILTVLIRRHLLGNNRHIIVVDDRPLVAAHVPKNENTSRVVIPQKNGSLFLQYPMGNQLELALEFLGISLAKQPSINASLAQRGSLFDNLDRDIYFGHRDSRACTVDLHASSEIIGTGLVSWMFPQDHFTYMASCRASEVEISGKIITLPSMANMGNAYCFPMQTLIYACLVLAIYKYFRLPLKDRDGTVTWSVFGDDIIVDRAAYGPLLSLLEDLGMVVNKNKSFAYGHFRESCGEDYICGYNVRPIMPKSIKTEADRYALLNLLVEWGIRHSVDLPRTVGFILKGLKHQFICSIDDPHDRGIRWDLNRLDLLPTSRRKQFKCISHATIKPGTRPSFSTRIELKTMYNLADPARFVWEEVTLFHLLRSALAERLTHTGRQKWISVERDVPEFLSGSEIGGCNTARRYDKYRVPAFWVFDDPRGIRGVGKRVRVRTQIYHNGICHDDRLRVRVTSAKTDNSLTMNYLLRTGL